MTNITEEKKPFIGKKPSPFNSDPYNNRGGKGGKGGKRGFVDNGGKNIKSSISMPKMKGGSGGDR